MSSNWKRLRTIIKITRDETFDQFYCWYREVLPVMYQSRDGYIKQLYVIGAFIHKHDMDYILKEKPDDQQGSRSRQYQ